MAELIELFFEVSEGSLFKSLMAESYLEGPES